MPHTAIEPEVRCRGRALRRDPTHAEHKLWQMLRVLKVQGFHFRRQAPIGPYIVDFVWHTGKLVIEVDGAQHAEAQREHDDRRTAWLKSQGYRVMRFWNNDVLKTREGVYDVILAEANAAMERLLTSPTPDLPVGPTPDPCPQGGGKKTQSGIK